MRLTVLTTPQAAADIEQTAVFFAADSIDAAIRFIDAVQARKESLAAYPRRGARVEIENPSLEEVRWISVGGFDSYLLFYTVDEVRVLILRVLHGARDLPPLLGDDV